MMQSGWHVVCTKLQTGSVGTAVAEGVATLLAGCMVPLDEFDYQNEWMGCVLRKRVSEDDFVGMIQDPVLLVAVLVIIADWNYWYLSA